MIATQDCPNIVAAAEDLVSGILLLRRNGPLEAARLAYTGRKCLLGLNTANRHRLRILRLQEAVANATKGSCLRWDADRIENALNAFLGIPATCAPSPVPECTSPELGLRFQTAYSAFELAVGFLDQSSDPANVTDDQAYDWLRDFGPGDYELPPFDTFRRYLSEARRFHGTNKKSPRRGREGRSIVRAQDLN